MKTHLTKFILFALIFIASCSKDENNDTPSNSNGITISVMGQIINESGQPLSNVQVSIGNKTSTTNTHGIYSFTGVSVLKNRAVIRTSRTGYWDCSKGFIPSKTDLNYCNLTMPVKSLSNTVSGTAGGTINSNGAALIFPANAFVNQAGTAYNGTVTVAVKHLPTNDVNFSSLIPGGDLMALNSAGEERVLISFGMMGVELTDNSGNALALAPGKNATIRIPIAPAQQSVAATTIPLWYFDENIQLWKEEGFATKQGNNYIGDVSHFTWWNCDDPGVGTIVNGRVVDCKGAPFPNARVYSTTGGYFYTNANGFYSQLAVVGITHSVFANAPGFVNSQTETSPVLVAGQTYTFPDLVIPCASPIPTIIIRTLDLNIIDCDSQLIANNLILYNSNGQYFFNSNAGHVNMTLPCGYYYIEANTLGASNRDSIYLDCNTDTTFKTIILCPPSQSTLSSIGFSLQLNINNFNLIDSIAVPVYVTPSTPAMFVNDLSTLTQDPGIGFYMSGIPYQPGLSQFSNPAVVQISFRTNNVLYEITPNVGTGGNFYVDLVKTGLPNDTVELNMYGDIWVQDLSTGLFQSGTMSSFHGKFIRP